MVSDDYGWAADPARRDFLLAARTNVFQVPFFNREQAERLEGLDEIAASLLERLAPGEFQLLVEVWHVRENGWTDADGAWLDQLIARLEGIGLGYGDWMLQTHDEILSDHFHAAATAVKKHNPRVRIFSDYLPRDPAVVERFAGVVDVWCPLAGFLPPKEKSFAEGFAAMRASGHPVWVYSCDSSPANGPLAYRRQAWLARHLGLDGVTYWMCKNAAWRDTPGRPNFGMTYLADDGRMLASRRWHQWRAGLEDYLLLRLAAERGDPALARRVEAMARRVAEADSAQAAEEAIAAARRELLAALSE